MSRVDTHKDLYSLKRDGPESERLNDQHVMFLNLTGGELINPLVDKNSLRVIADIATGTGIWLRDVNNLFNGSRPYPFLQGFDVSSAQFPDTKDNNCFSVHNVLDPFPSDEWNRYDLVHVRFLLPGLKDSDFQLAMTNISSIIKPGGYLQWEEEDFSKSFQLMTRTQPQLRELVDDILGYVKFHHLGFNASDAIENACINSGIKVISKTFHNTANAPPDQLPHIRSYFLRMMEMVLPVSYLDQGLVHDEKEAQAMYDGKISKVKSFFDEGLALDDVFACFLCQKS